jgi:hypothetical protein
MQGVVQGPPGGVHGYDFLPELAVCLQEFLERDGAEAQRGVQALRSHVEDLLIEVLEHGEVRGTAQGQGIAQDGLRACQPRGRQLDIIQRQLRGIVK